MDASLNKFKHIFLKIQFLDGNCWGISKKKLNKGISGGVSEWNSEWILQELLLEKVLGGVGKEIHVWILIEFLKKPLGKFTLEKSSKTKCLK